MGGTSFDVQDTDAQENSFAMDLSNSVKNGYLYMQDPIDKVRQQFLPCDNVCEVNWNL